ncbi:MAG TPA: flagellar basal body rod protein FlgB [Burkholderiaceae bacterium]|nr:flagellar basal body rod protein FlgB [Burkholderiaceae bacterium]
MLDRLTQTLDFNTQALLLRSERSRVLAGNMANADTPHFQARDFDFRQALASATGSGSAGLQTKPFRTHTGHLAAQGIGPHSPKMLYRTPMQNALDANTVDLDVERANYAENSLRYEASLRFLNGQIRSLLTSINGQ